MSKRSPKPARATGGSVRRKSAAKKGSAKRPKQTRARTKGGVAVGLKRAPRVAKTRTPRVGRREFPKLQKVDGLGAMIVVGERVGGRWDENRQTIQWVQKGGSGAVPAGRSRSSINRSVDALAAVAHVQRLTIMLKLLEGPATYAALRHATKLKAGPLYHHIGQLRLAGLILPKQRDLYELTRGGRNLMLAVAVIGPVTRDRRRRPIDQ